MNLLFLRHGEADWPRWDKPDDERPLTKRGRKEMKQVAEFLARLDFSPDAILSSPLPRALQTAEIVAEYLDRKVQVESDLAPGFALAQLRRLIAAAGVGRVMVVGHEPDFSDLIRELTGGRVKLSKGGIAMVETNPDGKSGRLRWLFPPKIAKSCP